MNTNRTYPKISPIKLRHASSQELIKKQKLIDELLNTINDSDTITFIRFVHKEFLLTSYFSGDFGRILEYLNNYPIQAVFKQSYVKLSYDDLRSLKKIYNHPTSQKLEKNTLKRRKAYFKYNESNYRISNTKKTLIDKILDECESYKNLYNLYYQVVAIPNIIDELRDNPDLATYDAIQSFKERNIQEEKTLSEEQKIESKSYIKNFLYIYYDSLTDKELVSHLNLLKENNTNGTLKNERLIRKEAFDRISRDIIENTKKVYHVRNFIWAIIKSVISSNSQLMELQKRL